MNQELNPVQRRFDALTCTVRRHAGVVVLLALCCGAFGVWRASKLKINQDLKALIPDDYPSVVRLNELSERIGNQSEFIVEIRSPDRDAAIAYGAELAKRMRTMDNAFLFVEFRRDVDWFRHNALLFLPIGKLLDLRARVIHRIREEVEEDTVEDVAGPQPEPPKPADGEETDEEEDPLELDDDALRDRYGKQYDVPTEYIETTDTDGSVVMVVRGRPVHATTDVDFTEEIVERMKSQLADMNPSSYHAGLQANIRGAYEERSGEVSSIKTELLGSSAYALGMLLLVLIAYFKRIRAVIVVLLPLILGVLLTLGVSTYIYEALNLVTAFIFVVLLGLGIDFGIHLYSRYEYERLRGADQEGALRTAGAYTGVDVAAGAVTTALMFSLFPIADFRGFSQFGVIACIGVVIALVFTLTVVPALVVLIERISPWKPRRWLPLIESKRHAAADKPTSEGGTRWRPISVAVIVVSLFVAGVSVYVAPDIEFEYDFTKLGKKPEEGGGNAGPPKKDFQDAIGRPNYGPALAMPSSTQEGEWVEDQLRGFRMLTDEQMERLMSDTLPPVELKHNDPDRSNPPPPLFEVDEEDEDDPFAQPEPDEFADMQAEVDAAELSPESKLVVETYALPRLREMRYFLWKHLSVWSFVPSRQTDKLRLIADIRRRIDNKYAAVNGEAQEKMDRLRRYLKVTEAVGLQAVPEWVRNRWTDNQGTYGRHAILWNRGAKADYKDAKRLQLAWFDMQVGPGGETTVPLAANYFVLPEIMDTLRRDGPRVLTASMIAIFLCLMVMFRSLRVTLLILLPLTASVLWLAGLFYLLEWKLNLYNVITFALIIGMGVDDGIHMVSRWLEGGQSSVGVAIRETGAAISLTSITTCIGFSGLLFANHIGLSTLGWTAAVGMILCFVASVTVLPAMLLLLGKRNAQRTGSPSPPQLTSP